MGTSRQPLSRDGSEVLAVSSGVWSCGNLVWGTTSTGLHVDTYCEAAGARDAPRTEAGHERQWVAVQRTSATSTTERRRRWDSELGQRSSCCSSTKPTISSGSRARMLHLASPARASTRAMAAYGCVQSCVLISPAVCMPPSAPRFRSGVRRCVDLCAAPGSWSQARRRRVYDPCC